MANNENGKKIFSKMNLLATCVKVINVKTTGANTSLVFQGKTKKGNMSVDIFKDHRLKKAIDFKDEFDITYPLEANGVSEKALYEIVFKQNEHSGSINIYLK